MGDRGNIIVSDGASTVYLYSHWTGSELPEILQRSLAKNWRWRDGSYLARIIFCEMVKGNELTETGFGISSKHGDHNHPCLEVAIDEQEVRLLDSCPAHICTARWSFKEFAEHGVELVEKEVKEC